MPDQTLPDTIATNLRRNRAAYFLVGLLKRILFELRAAAAALAYRLGVGTNQAGLPLPPPRLRYRVHGDLAAATFLESGWVISQDIVRLIQEQGLPLEKWRTYLDFGCGCGRVSRHLLEQAPHCVYTGVDIDGQAIAWDRINLSAAGTWLPIDPDPPTGLADASFQLIVALSVFTHLDEPRQLAWLEELARLLEPDGLGLLTIHGDSIIQQYRGRLDMDSATGFYYLQSNRGVRNYVGLPDFYQTAFHSRAYIDKVWSRYFQIVSYQDRAVSGHQSAVLVRKLPQS